MNKNTKVIISVLFAVIILLAVGITRFYIGNISDSPENKTQDIEIAEELDSDESGNRIFRSSNTLYGVIDKNDRVVVYPEWAELEFAGKNLCIASKRMEGRLLSGCIDCEGSVVVPFIYKDIIPCSMGEDFDFYVAETDSDGTCVVYNSRFVPCFMRSWDGFISDTGSLLLQSGSNNFIFSCTENGFNCRNAELNGNVQECSYTIDVYSRLILSKLDSSMLEKVSDGVSDYLSYAFTGDKSALERLGNPENFKMIFQDDENVVLKKLTAVPSVFIYSDKDENGELVFNVSITAETKIKYKDSDGVMKSLDGPYKALMRFRPSASQINAVSAVFEKESPDYPEDEEESEEKNDASNAENTDRVQ